MNRNIAYIRVSTNKQDLDNQRFAIHEYAHRNNIQIHEFIEVSMSSRCTPKERKIDELLQQLKTQDRLIVSELSRLGRSVGQVVMLIDELIKRKVQLVSVKENIYLNKESGIHTKVMVTIFSLLAELERELISLRTKEGLAAAKAKGKQLGRPLGSLSNHKLSGKDEEIQLLLSKGVSKASIAKILDVPRTTLLYFIKTRKLGKKKKPDNPK